VNAGRRELLLAAAAGGLLAGAWLWEPLEAAAALALAGVAVALDRRVARGAGPAAWFRLGWTAGAVHFLVGLHWIARLSDVAITVPALKYAGWVAGALFLACFWGLAAWGAGALARRSGVGARWTFVPAMLLAEELRGSGELGFPWFQPGYTQVHQPALALAAWGSVTLVTLWLLVVAATLASLVLRRRRATAGVLVLLLALPFAASHRPAPGTASGPWIAMVQGDVGGEYKWSGRHQAEILRDYLALSDTAMARSGPHGERPALVIWSETATGTYMRRQLEQSLAVAEWCASRHVPVFAGFAHYDYGPDGRPRPWNAAGTWEPDGRLSPVYAKRHLVPFGERMPFQWLVPALGRLDLGQAEWLPGTDPVLFPGPAGPFGCLICFESIFPDLAREDVRAGARMLVVLTNDEWFGRSVALPQHAAMSVFRAVENGVPLLRCANTGITEIVAPDGRVTARAEPWRATVLAGTVPAARPGPTPWVRWGDWPGGLALLSALLLALAPWRRVASRR
jgi:apolipoprotein N-acyltransferase